MADKATTSPSSGSRSFPTTNWSEIDKLKSNEFSGAIAALCERYWYPIYAFIRRRCADPHQAEDWTQSFFEKVLAKQMFREADPDKGRFRSYLRTNVRNFISTSIAAENTDRRGGGARVSPIDVVAAEEVFHRNCTKGSTPEDEFDRAWALTMLERAIERLKSEYDDKQQTLRFELFAPSLRSSPLDYDSIATKLDIDPVTARKAASRFRQRSGQLLREEIALTLSDSGDIDDEISWIMRQFAS